MQSSTNPSFLEQLEENFNKYPENLAVKSFHYKRGISYRELDIRSGSIHAWLKNHGIGKEDMVMILLPRGVRIVLSMIGVLRAGAAFIVCEEGYSEERIEFIKKDCGCRIIIDAELYDEMMNEEPLEGYEKSDPHDACFAVYTSGSTGYPKGVLHEYGKLTQIPLSMPETQGGSSSDVIHVIVPPFQFIAALISTFNALYRGNGISIMPYGQLKDTDEMSRFLKNERTNEVFLPFSVMKQYKNISKNIVSLYLGGEAITDFFVEGPEIYNIYASSESGAPVSVYKIDKSYDITPVGKNRIGNKILIMDEDGNILPDGQTGEICIKNEYTRGYINLPEKTNNAFRDGLYHMGDLGYINENGDLVVCGRVDDMIKIDGNRVEPREIELALKQVLELEKVLVKGYKEQDRTYICAYLIREELERKGLIDETGKLYIDQEKLREKLLEKIPYYMIPVYYSVIEKVPVNANGKVDKKQLSKPQICVSRRDYKAPANEIEDYFCQLFSQVLGVKEVSVLDDFYQIGGSSLSSIELISLCRYEDITTGNLFKYRTPEKLAAYYLDRNGYDDDDDEIRNEKALNHPQKILPEMEYLLDYQFMMPKSIMWNLPIFVKFKQGTDAKRLAQAVNKVIAHHPTMNTKFYYDKEANLVQAYYPYLSKQVKVEVLSEEELEMVKPDLVQPFRPIDACMHRERIFETEKGVYLFMDIYHSITDGTSYNILFDQIIECYKNMDTVLPVDYYYLKIRDYFKYLKSNEFKSIKKYYKEKIAAFKKEGPYTILPNPDRKNNKRNAKWIDRKLKTSTEDLGRNAILKEIGKNAFFLAACSLAVSEYNGGGNVVMQWTYHGRSSKKEMNTTGLLFKTLPIFASIKEDRSAADFLKDIHQQVNFGIRYSNAILYYVAGMEFEDTIFFLYQKNLLNMKKYDLVEYRNALAVKNRAMDSLIEFEIYDNDDEPGYRCTIGYSSDNYDTSSMERFYDIYDRIVYKLAHTENLEELKLSELLKGEKQHEEF